MPTDVHAARGAAGGLPNEPTRWKDSRRVAEFVANVVSCVAVLSVAGVYAVHFLSLVLTNAPAVSSYVHRHVVWTATNVSNVLVEGWDVLQHMDQNSVLSVTADVASSSPQLSPEAISKLTAAVVTLIVGVALLGKFRSIGWYVGLQIVVTLQWIVALYQFARILASMAAYSTVKLIKLAVSVIRLAYVSVFTVQDKHAAALRRLMRTAKSYNVWRQMATYLDTLEGKDNWKTQLRDEDMDVCDFRQIRRNLEVLQRAVDTPTPNVSELRYLLAACLSRNELGIDSPSLHLECHSGTKTIIDQYSAVIVRALDLLANAGEDVFPSIEKAVFFKAMKQRFGASALCLSGGGAIAMYHMGVIKALMEADLLPNVVSGTSGGSIAAAMLACKTNDELLHDIIQDDISTRFIEPFGIRWFPPLLEQLAHCVKTGFLVECSRFERTTRHYYGEPMEAEDKHMHYTFQDAFRKTGRHVCITVSAADVTGSTHKGPKKLLLDHINSPHVLLWSAVAVSCSLPGIMKGKQLMARDFEGNVVPYVSLGEEWCDGSLQHDLPMETMASCFNVTNFIVSQVNPHVVPFVGDEIDRPNFRKSAFHKLENVIAADIRHRLKMLAFLGLFPRIYGHEISAYFKQNFSGDVTLIPEFTLLESVGIKAILNPTVADMQRYNEGGQRVVWPKLTYIRHLCRIEKCLDHTLAQLLGEGVVPFNNWLCPPSRKTAEVVEDEEEEEDEFPRTC